MAEACILVVEDEPLLRELIVGELRESGFVVIEATSAPEAMERMAAHPEIDLLFTDILLGGGANGWDVAIAFRGLYPDRPVIYASAYAPGVPRRVPASVYFDKPYLPLQVVQAVRLLLANRPPVGTAHHVPEIAVVPPPAEGDADTVDIVPDPSPS